MLGAAPHAIQDPFRVRMKFMRSLFSKVILLMTIPPPWPSSADLTGPSLSKSEGIKS